MKTNTFAIRAFLSVLLSAGVLYGCGGTDSASDASSVTDAGGGTGDASLAQDSGAPGDGGADAGVDVGPYLRPEKGDPLTDDEVKAATQKYIDVLKGMPYFKVADDRVYSLSFEARTPSNRLLDLSEEQQDDGLISLPPVGVKGRVGGAHGAGEG